MQNIIIQTRQQLWRRCINKPVRDFHSINNSWHNRQSFYLQFLHTSSYYQKKNNTSKKDDVAIEPTFQDTEVPLYTFLDKESFNIDDDIKFEQQQNEQQSPPPSISKMLSILIPESKSLLTAVGALTMATVCTMQFPNAIGEVIDILNTGSSININDIDTQDTRDTQQAQIQSIALQLTGYFTIGSIATFVHTSMFDITGQKIGANLRKELFSKLIHRNVAFFDRNRAGELANRLSTDVHEVAEHLVQNIELFLSNFVRAITASVQMILISPQLSVYLSPLPIMLWGCTTFYGKFIKHWSKQHLNSLAQSTHVATERFGGHRTMVSFGQRDMEQKRYSGIIEAAYLYSRRVAMFQGSFLGSSYLIGNGYLVLVLIVGSFQVLDGNISAGNLAGFCMYCGHLTESVLDLSAATGGFLKAQGSGARLFNLLDESENTNVEKESSLTLPPSYNASVRFEDVEFAYPSHSNILVLNKVSFTLNEGQILGITAPSGSGKSSIINLMMKFYEPTSGKITLDETDIKELDEDWFRSQIALVQQEPILFHASVYENVAYGKPNATREEVIEACIAANAHEFIMDMPEGYDTIVGERGASISGGQKQRLCIARALLMKPKILCLDESSSALDSLTEKDFLHRLRELVNSEDTNLSAVIFMTHKQSVLQVCDRVAVLTDGKIQEVENNALAGLLM